MIEAYTTSFTFQPDHCGMAFKKLGVGRGLAPMGLPFPANFLVSYQRADTMQLVPSIALGLKLSGGFRLIAIWVFSSRS